MTDRYYAQIVNPKHPHYTEFGYCTGEILDSTRAGIMERFELENCRHGADSCYVRLGETGIRRHPDDVETERLVKIGMEVFHKVRDRMDKRRSEPQP